MTLPRLNFTITLLIAFALVFTLGLGLAVLGFRSAGQRAAIETADTSLAQVAATVAARANARVRPVLGILRHAAELGMAQPNGLTLDTAEPLLDILRAEPELRTVSVAWADGTLIQALPAAALAPDIAPPLPDGTDIVLRFAQSGLAMNRWLFLDRHAQPLGSAEWGKPDDPRDMIWYLQASEPGIHISTLYRLGLTGHPGLSASTRLSDGGVIAFDITLAKLRTFLRAQQLSPNTLAFLFNDLGILLAHPDDRIATGNAGGTSVAWTTLQSAGDGRLRAVWEAYASNRLLPGGGILLSANGKPTIARLEAIESLAVPPVLVAVVAPRSDFTAAVDDSVWHGSLLALGAFAVGLAAISLVAWRVAHPLGILMREAQTIRRLDLAAPLRLRSHITEVQGLAEAVAAMKATLNSFAVYLPRDLVRQYLAAGTEPKLGGERVTLSLMFTDVQGFTSISESLDPMQLTQIASAYFEEVTHELLASGATIDKYIGDAVMAFWNAPRRDRDHAKHACLAALRTRAATVRLAADFIARGWPALPTRFGVHTGDAVVGNVGSSDRMTFTAMGSMVNLANRLEGLNKQYGTQILVSEATRMAAGDGFVFRPVDIVVLKGTVSPIPVYELLGVTDPAAPAEWRASEQDVASLELWTRCVIAYRRGRFDEAREALRQVNEILRSPLVRLYTERLATLGAAASVDWNPTVRMTEK